MASGGVREALYQKYWVEGKGQRQVAEEMGTSQHTVSRYMRELGIPNRSASEARSGKHNTQTGKPKSEEWKQMMREKRTGAQFPQFWLEKHPRYKHGKYAYRKHLKRTGRFEKCEICGRPEVKIRVSNLHIHHKDGNRENNSLANLMVVCASCHKKLHPHPENKFWEHRKNISKVAMKCNGLPVTGTAQASLSSKERRNTYSEASTSTS